MISEDRWRRIRSKNPFHSFEFHEALRVSGCIGEETGWIQSYLTSAEGSGFLIPYRKLHSYGEFIFDWAWAQASERSGLPYYPKLTTMIPFTPATASPFFLEAPTDAGKTALLKSFEDFYHMVPDSSAHFLFLPPDELELFRAHGYLIRESLQYHFFNEGHKDFEVLLSCMKGKKAKTVQKERHFPGLEISQYTGEDLNREHAKRMFEYYSSTIEEKSSYQYLNALFFERVFERLSSQILFVEASESGQPVAGSLFFYDEERLYGRYWGAKKFIPYLHFELCYYQGIDFTLNHKLSVFEAGAQGEHKIARGFRPVTIFSAHKLKHKQFQRAVEDYIDREKQEVNRLIQDLSKHLPFRS